MTAKSYTTSFSVKQAPAEVYAAILNPRAWWGRGIAGETARLGGEFTYRHGQVHLSTQKIAELVPDQRVVWQITGSRLSFVPHAEEWQGTSVIFEIHAMAGHTEVRITHAGLVPQLACFEGCSAGWNFYLLESLKPLIETGRGQPDPVEKSAA